MKPSTFFHISFISLVCFTLASPIPTLEKRRKGQCTATLTALDHPPFIGLFELHITRNGGHWSTGFTDGAKRIDLADQDAWQFASKKFEWAWSSTDFPPMSDYPGYKSFYTTIFVRLRSNSSPGRPTYLW